MELARIERAEAAAVADNGRAAPSRLAEQEGIGLLEADGVTALAVRSLPESRVHNHAYGIGGVADVERVEASTGSAIARTCSRRRRGRCSTRFSRRAATRAAMPG